jgi:hypothetical protein
MKLTTKIRFTEPQIALVMHAHPNCNLDHLTELFFDLHRHDQARREYRARLCRSRARALVRDGTLPIHNSTNQRHDIAVSERRE